VEQGREVESELDLDCAKDSNININAGVGQE
jgi:hypothetical protein